MLMPNDIILMLGSSQIIMEPKSNRKSIGKQWKLIEYRWDPRILTGGGGTTNHVIWPQHDIMLYRLMTFGGLPKLRKSGHMTSTWHHIWHWCAPANVIYDVMLMPDDMTYDVGQRLQSHWWSVAMSYDIIYDVGWRPKSHVWCHVDVIMMSYDVGVVPDHHGTKIQ